MNVLDVVVIVQQSNQFTSGGVTRRGLEQNNSRLAEKSPALMQHQGRQQKRGYGVGPGRIPELDRDTDDEHHDRAEGVDSQVGDSGPQIQVGSGVAMESQSAGAVDDEPHYPQDYDAGTFDMWIPTQPTNRLDGDPERRCYEQHGVDKSTENLNPLQAIGELGGARALGSSKCESSEKLSHYIRGLMSGVGPQGQGTEQCAPGQHCHQEHAVGGQGRIQSATPSYVGSRVRVVMSHCLSSVPEAPST